jgi:hypothetical protein
MMRFKKRFQVYEQRIGNDTVLTIYIYGVDKIGVDYALGAWYHSDKGLCWATKGQLDDIEFYNGHFFQRYAERFIGKSMNILEAAIEFYKEFKPSVARHTEEIEKGVYKMQLPLSVGGLALGIHDKNSNLVVYNTYVSAGQLGNNQLDAIDADKELNESIKNMTDTEWRLLGQVLKQ